MKKENDNVVEAEVVDVKKDQPKKVKERVIVRKYERRDTGNIVWGLLLVLGGLTLLLNNMGLVSPIIWEVLLRFWPVLLILAGVHILVGNSPVADLVMTLTAILVLGSIWVRALIEVNSPIVYMWGLDTLPWFEWLKSLNLQRLNI